MAIAKHFHIKLIQDKITTYILKILGGPIRSEKHYLKLKKEAAQFFPEIILKSAIEQPSSIKWIEDYSEETTNNLLNEVPLETIMLSQPTKIDDADVDKDVEEDVKQDILAKNIQDIKNFGNVLVLLLKKMKIKKEFTETSKLSNDHTFEETLNQWFDLSNPETHESINLNIRCFLS